VAERTLILDIGLFEPRCGDRTRWTEDVFFDLLELLARENGRVLRCGRIPLLYASGVRWEAEPADKEVFMTIPAILRDGKADCEDLVAWRVAELRASGEPAQFLLRRWNLDRLRSMGVQLDGDDSGLRYHVLVMRFAPTRDSLGRVMWTPAAIEDPSAALGMPSNAAESRLSRMPEVRGTTLVGPTMEARCRTDRCRIRAA
jgi:hypothetical protein